MWYVYILRDRLNTSRYYLGYTENLKRRMREHEEKRSAYTGRLGEWELLYYEAYVLEKQARKRERKLKAHGRSWQLLKSRVTEELE